MLDNYGLCTTCMKIISSYRDHGNFKIFHASYGLNIFPCFFSISTFVNLGISSESLTTDDNSTRIRPQTICSITLECTTAIQQLHPGKLTWNIIMEVWKIIFLSKWVIYMFHVNLPGCILPSLKLTAKAPENRPPQ